MDEDAANQGEEQSHEDDTPKAEDAEAPQVEEPAVSGDAEEIIEDDFECQECTPARILPDPGQPTQKQLDDHRIDHLPFRSWCPECVAGRATGEQHVKRKDVKQVSTFSMDYLYCTKSRIVSRDELEEGEEVELKALVAKDSKSKTVFAHAMETKGSDEAGYAVARMVEDIAWLGHTRIILKF